MPTIYISNLDGALGDIDRAIERALEICGGTAESYAKQRCPTKTSNLKNSITHDVHGNTVTIGTDVEYAPYVEFGHIQQPGRYVPAIGKRLKASHVAAKPYLRPAVEDHVSQYTAIIQGELNI